MSESRISVEIVAPVHNRREITLQCLKSLQRIESSGLNVHVIIVDDGSTDGTSDAIRNEFPEVEIVSGDGNLWFTEGTNSGMRAALEHDPKYILTINDDSVFDANFLRSMVETAEKHAQSVVGSLLLLWDTPHKLFQTAPVWDTWGGGWRHWRSQTVWTVPDGPWKVDIIVGNCVLFPVQAILEAGLMDSARYPNYGDAEYTPRLKRLGWQLLIEPRARVFCQPNSMPARVSEMSPREKVLGLFWDLGKPHNLRRRFFAMWDGAPTKIQGVIAFALFLVRAAFGRSLESSSAPLQPEKPVAETFASRTLER